MLSRPQAIVLLKKYIHDENIIKKSLAAEAILKNLAKNLHKNEELWALTGLLHNIDYEYTSDNPQDRGVLSEKILSGLIKEEAVNAIKGNNYLHTEYAPVTSLDRSLIATSEMTNLMFKIIKFCEKNNENVIDMQLIFEKYNNKEFAPDVKRNRIKVINDVGLDLKEFFKITLKSIIEIKEELEI